MTGVETNLPTAPPSIPTFLISSVVRNELPARRSRRFQKIRSFFSCMLPRSTVYKNRWNKTCQLDSKCKGLTRNLVIKEIGIDGIAMDDTNEEYVDAPSSKTNKKPLSKGICHHSTKSMDFEDSYSSDLDSPRFSCRKSTLKIVRIVQSAGIPSRLANSFTRWTASQPGEFFKLVFYFLPQVIRVSDVLNTYLETTSWTSCIKWGQISNAVPGFLSQA
eukprot:scaffold340_cov190-Chaetoceros_neogracile.AAC.5